MKNETKSKLALWVSLLAVIILPLIGSFITNKGLPPGFGVFPPQKVLPEPGFNLIYFIVIALGEIFVISFILFPKRFNFSQEVEKQASPKKNLNYYPIWFWPGLAIMLISWVLMWGNFPALESLQHFTFVPLWWGFIVTLDGIVYKRNGGVSLISSRFKELIVLSIVSIVGWYLFEYLNYFVNGNWVYPNNKILSHIGNILWFTLAYTTVWPSIFEWYTLLCTIDSLGKRYENGPKINFSYNWGKLFIFLGVVITLCTGLFSYLFFWGIWIGPLLIFSGVLILNDYWTVYTPIAKGNWKPIVLISLSSLFDGFFWETWNYGSQAFHHNIQINPNFWLYEVPYVNVIKIFSEMPLLGFFGYLPFGVLCWIFWLWTAHVFNLNPQFEITKNIKTKSTRRIIRNDEEFKV